MTANLTPPDWMTGDDGMPELEDRDYVYMLELAIDFDYQWRAIYGLLARNQKTDDELGAEIRESEEYAKKLTGIWNDHAVEECIDLMKYSTYQGAAHCMSALGMLAPFIEGVFAQSFDAIGREYFSAGSKPSAHGRWTTATEKTWDCRYYYDGRKFQKNFLAGAKQLAEETGLQKYLPSEVWPALGALYAYRNRMFHNGFEWPLSERQKFQRQITKENWPATWFSQSTTGGDPWVFHVTQEFIDHCCDLAHKMIEAFGRLIKNDLWRRKLSSA